MATFKFAVPTGGSVEEGTKKGEFNVFGSTAAEQEDVTVYASTAATQENAALAGTFKVLSGATAIGITKGETVDLSGVTSAAFAFTASSAFDTLTFDATGTTLADIAWQITGGSGADTITANAKNDTINGGAGDDLIVIGSNVKEVTITDATGNDVWNITSADSIESFLYEDGKLIQVDALNGESTANGLVINVGDTDLTNVNVVLNGTTSTLAEKLFTGTPVDAFNETNTLGASAKAVAAPPRFAGAYADLKVDAAKGVIVGARTLNIDTIKQAAADAGRDLYAVDFAYLTKAAKRTLGDDSISAVEVDLNDSDWPATVVAVRGSNAVNNYITGSAKTNNTLIGGNGEVSNTLAGGGASRDTLVLGNVTGEGNSNEVLFGNGDGIDTVIGYMGNAKVPGDTYRDYIHFTDMNIAEVTQDKGNIVVVTDEGDRLVIKSGDDKKLTDVALNYMESGSGIQRLKVGDGKTALTYESDVSLYDYNSGEANGTLNVTGDDDHVVWLQDIDGLGGGKAYAGFSTIDASKSTGYDQLVGNGRDNASIVAGQGRATLWGGEGSSDDTLNGGKRGSDSLAKDFYFGAGGGNDIITNSSLGDKVVIFGSTLDQVDAENTGLVGGTLKIAFQDGSSISVRNWNSGSVNNFVFNDDAAGAMKYDRASGGFVSR